MQPAEAWNCKFEAAFDLDTEKSVRVATTIVMIFAGVILCSPLPSFVVTQFSESSMFSLTTRLADIYS